MSNLRQRNYAVLFALIALGGLIFAITVARLSEGTARRMADDARQSEVHDSHADTLAQP